MSFEDQFSAFGAWMTEGVALAREEGRLIGRAEMLSDLIEGPLSPLKNSFSLTAQSLDVQLKQHREKIAAWRRRKPIIT